MKRIHAAALCFAVLMTGSLAGCQTAKPSAQPQPEGSGFLSDYGRLAKEGSLRNRHLAYADPSGGTRKVQTLHLLPVVRFPARAAFDGVDEAVVADVLTYVEQRLRAQLSGRVVLAKAPEAADVTLQVALTGMAAQPEGKTALDLVPLRLITAPIKNMAWGKALEAAATLELRVVDARSAKVLREALYQVAGEGIGRADSGTTRVTLDSLKPALDSWVAGVADQVAPRP
ncbi:MAG: DUF3313 domain-containing protein [Methylibium sp.]|uniref:DUF3313 family protein n=1 Tax=Methylibium sp. TaxID=2067992 RepID=UPI001796BC4F|nr:DUF3313 family protein [Methylibium sp.]MBA2723511.1 DUF3313 domain-containing protein [Methylibium sp.]MBA3589560.1 DUF3313 domain-containing protein [Methylibium sp.]